VSLDVVFFDIGGVIYDDAVYERAVLLGLRDLGAEVTDEEYAAAYEALRRAQSGSFRDRLAARFLPGDVDRETVTAHVSRYWANAPEALLPDVRPCLEALRDAGYLLGVLANQPSEVRLAMERDELDAFFTWMGISDDLGLEKPDPRIFAHAVEVTGADPARCTMVGDRLDYDVRAAKAAGMRAVWVLRGEAPSAPTPEQLAEPDASVRSLAELPEVLRALGA
jgi:putative hydrolase of the HAD superfamily